MIIYYALRSYDVIALWAKNAIITQARLASLQCRLDRCNLGLVSVFRKWGKKYKFATCFTSSFAKVHLFTNSIELCEPLLKVILLGFCGICSRIYLLRVLFFSFVIPPQINHFLGGFFSILKWYSVAIIDIKRWDT